MTARDAPTARHTAHLGAPVEVDDLGARGAGLGGRGEVVALDHQHGAEEQREDVERGDDLWGEGEVPEGMRGLRGVGEVSALDRRAKQGWVYSAWLGGRRNAAPTEILGLRTHSSLGMGEIERKEKKKVLRAHAPQAANG